VNGDGFDAACRRAAKDQGEKTRFVRPLADRADRPNGSATAMSESSSSGGSLALSNEGYVGQAAQHSAR
jgi:hypothetical protein